MKYTLGNSPIAFNLNLRAIREDYKFLRIWEDGEDYNNFRNSLEYTECKLTLSKDSTFNFCKFVFTKKYHIVYRLLDNRVLIKETNYLDRIKKFEKDIFKRNSNFVLLYKNY